MSYVASALVGNQLGKFLCGVYPQYAPEDDLGEGMLGIIVMEDLDDALDSVGLILMLLKTKAAEVNVDPDELAAYIEKAGLLLAQLTKLGERCAEKIQQDIDELDDLLDEDEELDEDAVDEVMACDCPLCEEENENI